MLKFLIFLLVKSFKFISLCRYYMYKIWSTVSSQVLPTLILGVERLLKEVDEKGLSATNRFEPDFNPINFLAQYLMRNNPRYSNFAEASPYVRGLREVSEELKQELFTFEDNR